MMVVQARAWLARVGSVELPRKVLQMLDLEKAAPQVVGLQQVDKGKEVGHLPGVVLLGALVTLLAWLALGLGKGLRPETETEKNAVA